MESENEAAKTKAAATMTSIRYDDLYSDKSK